jgi:diguanylate cyclase (GGDEF)-like protein
MYSLFFTLFTLLLSPVSAQESTYQTNLNLADFKDGGNISFTHDTSQYEKTLEQGNSYYKKKRYFKAIEQYTQSLKHLPKGDNAAQKHFGETYTKIAQSYKRLKDRKNTAYFYKKSLDAFTLLKNKKHMARTLNTLAEAERYLGNLVIALDYSTESLKIHETINDPNGQAKALMGAGIIYRHIGRYEKSLEHIYKAYLYYKKIKYENGIAKTSNEMGLIYIRLEQFSQAKFFFQETINIPEDRLEPKTLASALREMAVIDFNHGDYESAMLVATKAYEIYQMENEKLKESLTARIIANIYRAQQDNINAIDYYNRSLDIAIENGNEKYQIEAQIPLAKMLIVQDTNKAIHLLTSALEIAIKINDEKQTFQAYHKLMQAEDYRGNFKKALSYAKKEIALAKIIQKKSESKKLILAKATLHSHKLEIELASLRERAKLDQLELTKKNNEIKIVKQTKTINELKLVKNQYASIALAFSLVICMFLVFFIYRNFSASKKQNKELNYLVSRDPLTNCYNRRGLFELMDRYLVSSELDKEYCIMMVDIDHFKNVNDTYGHSIGDSVIRGFASVLQSCIRQNDIIARYGGEEFCIVLHHISYQKAMAIAENMRYKIEMSNFDDVTITSSFGITSLQFGALTTLELIAQADVALYKSKSLGRNKVTLWDRSFNMNDLSITKNTLYKNRG